MFNNLLAAGPVDQSGSITNPAFGQGFLGQILALPNATDFLNIFLPNIITLCFIIASIIFFFMIVTGAVQWIASGGDKQSLEAARGKITNAIIGIIILFSTFAIIKVIEGFFGIHILTIDIGPLIIR